MNNAMFLDRISDSIIEGSSVNLEGTWSVNAELKDKLYVVSLYCSGFQNKVFVALTLDEVCRQASTWYDGDGAVTLTPSQYMAQVFLQQPSL